MRLQDRRLELRLPRDLHAAAEARANEQGISLGAYLRQLLARDLAVQLPAHGNTKQR